MAKQNEIDDVGDSWGAVVSEASPMAIELRQKEREAVNKIYRWHMWEKSLKIEKQREVENLKQAEKALRSVVEGAERG